MQSIVFAFEFACFVFRVVIVKHWFVVNSFMDLNGMGLSSLLFDPVVFRSREN